MELPPSRPAASRCPPDICILIGSNPVQYQKEKPHRLVWFFFLAEDEGFEPPQTESESGVLPLHKSSKWNVLIIRKQAKKSRAFWPVCNFISFLLPIPRGKASQSAHLRADNGRSLFPPHREAWSEYMPVLAPFGDGSALFLGF